MEGGSLADVGSMNYKAGAREEKMGHAGLEDSSVPEDYDSVSEESNIAPAL